MVNCMFSVARERWFHRVRHSDCDDSIYCEEICSRPKDDDRIQIRKIDGIPEDVKGTENRLATLSQKKKTQEKAKSRLECNMHNKATSREVGRSRSTKGDPRHLIEYQHENCLKTILSRKG